MKVELSKAVADELRNTLAEVISDMSSEIADTDNPPSDPTCKNVGCNSNPFWSRLTTLDSA